LTAEDHHVIFIPDQRERHLGGRLQIGMPSGFASERRPASNRNTRPASSVSATQQAFPGFSPEDKHAVVPCSGTRRAADTVYDELAVVITGNRDALLDSLHKRP